MGLKARTERMIKSQNKWKIKLVFHDHEIESKNKSALMGTFYSAAHCNHTAI